MLRGAQGLGPEALRGGERGAPARQAVRGVSGAWYGAQGRGVSERPPSWHGSIQHIALGHQRASVGLDRREQVCFRSSSHVPFICMLRTAGSGRQLAQKGGGTRHGKYGAPWLVIHPAQERLAAAGTAGIHGQLRKRTGDAGFARVAQSLLRRRQAVDVCGAGRSEAVGQAE